MIYDASNLFYPNPQSGISFNMQIDTGDVFSLTDFNTCMFIHLTARTIITKVWLHVPYKKSVNYILMQPNLIDYTVGEGGILWGSNVLPNPVYPNSFVYGTLSFKVDYKLNICCDGMAGIADKADDLWNRYNHLFEPAQIGMQMHTLKEHKNYELISSNPYDARNWREIPKITNGDYDLVILNETNPVEVPRTGDYVFIPFKTENYNWKYNPSGISSCEHKNNHNYVKFNVKVNDTQYSSHTESWYKNALFMQNDDCDGYIWQKKHKPNDYILYYPFYGFGWAKIYPNDRYMLNDTGLYNIVSKNTGEFVTAGEFVVRMLYNGVWFVSKDGTKWKQTDTKIPVKAFQAQFVSGSPVHIESFGVFPGLDGYFYTFTIDSEGIPTVTKADFHGHAVDILGSVGGYLLFTRQDDIKPHKTVYRIGYDGIKETCIDTGWGNNLTFGCADKYYICKFIQNMYPNPNVRWVYYSTDGFLSATGISSLNELQNYGDNWDITYFNGIFYSWVRRQDAVIPNKYYWDCKEIINGSQVWQNTLRTYDIEFCGWHTSEPRQSDIPHDGHIGHIDIVRPGVYLDKAMNGGPWYFKDGKLSDGFGWALYSIGAFTAIIGYCNPENKRAIYRTAPFEDCPGSFIFQSSNTQFAYLIDPNNDTWPVPW